MVSHYSDLDQAPDARAGVGVSIILPIMNERENLPSLLEQIETAMGPTGRVFEVVAVDDGSTDGSDALLATMADQKPWLRVIRFRRNYGQAAAFDAGFRHASGAIVVTMDADLQNDPADIPSMIALLEDGPYDFVAGRRKARQDHFFSRKLPSKIANWIIRRVTRTQIRDLGCSLKVYRRELVKDLRLYGEMHRFVGVLVEDMGARVGQMDVNHRPRTAGKTKYGLMRTFKVLLDLVTIWFMRGFQTKPIYVFGGIGMLMMLAAIGLSGYVLFEKFFYGIFVHRNPLFALSMVLALMSVQFLAMGLIAEMIIRTYFESRDRPPYLIASRKGFEPARENGHPEQQPHIELTIGPGLVRSRDEEPVAK